MGIGRIFTMVDEVPKHPNQICEALLEGILLGINDPL